MNNCSKPKHIILFHNLFSLIVLVMKLSNNILILQKEHEIQDQHCRCADMLQSGACDLPTQLSKLLLDVDGGWNGAQQIYFNV